jgi:hypothetical protein
VRTDYIYAELYTHRVDGFYEATFINPSGKPEEFAGQAYEVIHLNHLAAQGWRVVQQLLVDDVRSSYLLERERADVREAPQLH